MKEFNKIACTEELKAILAYWMRDMVDAVHGGYLGRIDAQDRIDESAGKGLVLNSRILWAFSAAYQTLGEGEYEVYATRAYDYLVERFMDHESGGMYWMLDHMGQPLDTKKQIYAQAFAIYGLSEYYKVSQDPRARDTAMDLFDAIERYSFDTVSNGYFEAFDREWNLLDDLRLSDKDANEAKTMNTHLHVLEAYSNLYKVTQDQRVYTQLRNLMELFLDKFLNPKTYQYELFFDEDWNLKSNEISYGHDIETAWLLYEAAATLEDEDLLERTGVLAVQTVEATLPFFDTDGALFNAGVPGQIEDKDKHWWPQAEALVGLVNAYQLSGREIFWAQAKKCWGFIQQQLIDRHHGEWIWGIYADGSQMQEDKAGPWKCPYHNGRAMIEMIKRLD
ncbi:N-acyl-D-glucosamine 2-epimerase [Reichenbachiella sp. 5M10]|uniref:AGE family epimerase/isomerase n=1 Tax=Reichenbachiella sp. 5M10 TaxID=1889772 RepID=UPI000C15527D|nr:AGE family epimerase/isomerase [Reichenbachiella sp. 5M10]PIB36228.1 N-acyl-D-glucosamine 2-epimerase [Reichenbachiella sp. 5M10]